MRIIISGNRTVTDYEVVKTAIELALPFFEKIEVVMSGCDRGVDKFGERWAGENNIEIEKYPADWNKHGKSAGYKRNELMVSIADGLIAIWDGNCNTTKHIINTAREKGLKVMVVTYKDGKAVLA